MIETILKIEDIFYPEEDKEFPLELELGLEYFLKVSAGIPDDQLGDFSIGKIKIYSSEDHEIFFEHSFYVKDNKKFKCENVKSHKDNFCCATLTYDFPKFKENWGFIVFIEIKRINNELINNLNINSDKKQELYTLIKRYLNDDFIGAITDISNFSEYIALVIANKTGKSPSDFRSAVNILCNYDITRKSKINYNYVGSLLWPLYYIRNQKSHAYPLIEFNKYIALTTFIVFSEIIRYVSKNKIKL